MAKYYEVIGKKNGKEYRLGFTSNKYAFQRNSGWAMKDLKFILKRSK
jgi:hypothetical protein